MKRTRARGRVVVVFVTCPTVAVARRLGRELVRRQLAACVNQLPAIESTFQWKGKLERCREVLLIIKTTAKRVEPLRRAIMTLHPYDVPEVIALPVIAGHAPYLQWVRQSVASSGRSA